MVPASPATRPSASCSIRRRFISDTRCSPARPPGRDRDLELGRHQNRGQRQNRGGHEQHRVGGIVGEQPLERDQRGGELADLVVVRGTEVALGRALDVHSRGLERSRERVGPPFSPTIRIFISQALPGLGVTTAPARAASRFGRGVIDSMGDEAASGTAERGRRGDPAPDLVPELPDHGRDPRSGRTPPGGSPHADRDAHRLLASVRLRPRRMMRWTG